MTPQDCFQELRPTLDGVARVIKASPLSCKDRAGLALLAAAHMFATACAALQETDPKLGHKPNAAIARTVADTLVGLLERPDVPQ